VIENLPSLLVHWRQISAESSAQNSYITKQHDARTDFRQCHLSVVTVRARYLHQCAHWVNDCCSAAAPKAAGVIAENRY